MGFLETLPVRKIPNIGGMTETALRELGITTGKDLLDKVPDVMIGYSNYPKTHTFLTRCALGIGQVLHDDELVEQKGISISKTFTPVKTKPDF